MRNQKFVLLEHDVMHRNVSHIACDGNDTPGALLCPFAQKSHFAT